MDEKQFRIACIMILIVVMMILVSCYACSFDLDTFKGKLILAVPVFAGFLLVEPFEHGIQLLFPKKFPPPRVYTYSDGYRYGLEKGRKKGLLEGYYKGYHDCRDGKKVDPPLEYYDDLENDE